MEIYQIGAITLFVFSWTLFYYFTILMTIYQIGAITLFVLFVNILRCVCTGGRIVEEKNNNNKKNNNKKKHKKKKKHEIPTPSKKESK